MKKLFLGYGKATAVADILAGAYHDLNIGMHKPAQDSPRREIYDQFVAAAHKQLAAAAGRGATDTAFVLNKDALSKPQQEFFNKLNEIIAILGTSPDDFDKQFRFTAYKMMAHSAADLAVEVVTQYTPEAMRSKNAMLARMPRLNPVPASLEYVFTPGRKEAKREEEEKLYPISLHQAFGIVRNKLAAAFGVYIPKPPNSTEEENGLLRFMHEEHFGMAAPGSIPRQADGRLTNYNVLQGYCEGFHDLAALPYIKEKTTTKKTTLIISGADRQFLGAIAVAIRELVVKKHLGPEAQAQLSEKLGEMEKLWPLALMDADTYRATETHNGGREAHADAERKRQQHDALRLKRHNTRQAEIQAAKPKPYAPASVSFSRLKTAKAFIYEQELAPLLQSIDCRIEAHKKLADIIFAEPVMAVLEAQFRGKHVRGAINANAEMLATAEAAVREFIAMDIKNVPADQRNRHLKIKQALMQSPMLLAHLGGDEQLIRNCSDWQNLVDDWDDRNSVAQAKLMYVKETFLKPPAPPTPSVEDNPATTPAETTAIAAAALAAAAAGHEIATPENEKPAPPPKRPDVPLTVLQDPPKAELPKASEPPEPVFENAYERLRFYRRNETSYKQAEDAMLTSVRYAAADWVSQHQCTEAECRMESTASGYELWLSFGKDGKTLSQQVIPMHVRHTDDANDILVAVEDVLFGDKGYNLKPLFAIPEASSKKPRKPMFFNTNQTRNEGVSQLILKLNPDDVKINGNNGEWPIPPLKDKPVIEGRVISSDGSKMGLATLVLRHWRVSKRGGRPRCETLNIPLGTKIDNTEEVNIRLRHSIGFMQEFLGIREIVTKEDVIQDLKKSVEEREKDWLNPKGGIYVDGYESPRELAFPQSDYGQHTRLSAGMIYDQKMEGGNDSLTLNFSLQVKDDALGDNRWHYVNGRGINLHTSNPALAQARAHWVMDRLVAMFEQTLNQGQNVSRKQFLPDGHYWQLGQPNAKGECRLLGDPDHDTQPHARKARMNNGEEIPDMDKPHINWRKVIPLMDYFIGSFADDVSIRPVNIESHNGKARFTLQLVRATRENYSVSEDPTNPAQVRLNPYYRVGGEGNDPRLPGEVMQIEKSDKSDIKLPVQVTLELDTKGRSAQDVRRTIEEFSHIVDKSIKHTTGIRYKAFTMNKGTEKIKDARRYSTMGVINDFVDTLRSHLGKDENITIAGDGLNEMLARKFIERRGGAGKMEMPNGEASYLPPQRPGAWEDRINSGDSRSQHLY